jgi:hypothetical protein
MNLKITLNEILILHLLPERKKERILREFENRVLRILYEPKREKVVVDWRRLHNEELHICTIYQVLLG